MTLLSIVIIPGVWLFVKYMQFATNQPQSCAHKTPGHAGISPAARFRSLALPGEILGTSINAKYGNLACGENTLALRLVSELPDLRAGYANPIVRYAHEMGSRRVTKKEDGVTVLLHPLFW